MAESPFPRGWEMLGLHRHVLARPPKQDVLASMPVDMDLDSVPNVDEGDPSVTGLALNWCNARHGWYVCVCCDDAVACSCDPPHQAP